MIRPARAVHLLSPTLALLSLIAVAPAWAASPVLVIKGPAGPAVEMSASDIAAMPHVTVNMTIHGHAARYSGVPLTLLMPKIGAPQGEALRGAALAEILVARACDGYRVAFSLAEIDPALGGESVIVADKVDDRPLTSPDGPFRLIVAGDKRAARAARCVVALEVISPP